jgi:hypothetical protein
MHRKIYVATTWALLLFLGRETLAAQSEQPTYYWNPPAGGTGNWNTSDPNWSTSPLGPANQAWSNTGGTAPYDAVFGGSSGIVSLTNDIVANIVHFDTSSYVMQQPGGALTVNGFDTGGNSATVSNAFIAPLGLSKYGAGNLDLFTSYFQTAGPIRVQDGTLRINGAFQSLPNGTTTKVSDGAALEILGPTGGSSNRADVVAMPNATIRVAPPSSSYQQLQNIYLAGGTLVGASGGSTSSDMRVNSAIVTRGTVASSIDVANGILFTTQQGTSILYVAPFGSLSVNDVTRDDKSDLVVTGTAVSGAFQGASMFWPLVKSGSGTLTIDANNSSPTSRFWINK